MGRLGTKVAATVLAAVAAITMLAASSASSTRSRAIRPHAFERRGHPSHATRPRGIPAARLRAGARRERRARAAKLRQRRTHHGRVELRRSANAFRSLGPAQALAAAPAAIEAPAWRPTPPGQQVRSYLDDNAAVIDAGPAGRRAVLESTLPLRVGSQPADLSLTAAGSSLEPANPVVGTRIGGRAGDGVELTDVGVTLAPAMLRHDSAATKAGDAAFYPNVDADADAFLKPLPAGAESYTVLRSDRSPRVLAYKLGVPDGAQLGPSQRIPGGFQVARGSDVLADVTPASATDADGLPVKTATRLVGDELIVHVEHARGHTRYPVTVDPAIVEDFRDWRTNTALDFNGWAFFASPSTKFQYWYGNAYLGNGLYEYSHTQNSYNYGDYAEWYFNVLGFGQAFIYRADFDNTIHEAQGTCIVRGLYSRVTSGWESGYWSSTVGGAQSASPSTTCSSIASPGTNQVHCVRADCSPAGDPGNLLAFMLYASSTATRTYFTGYLGGAAAYEYDFVTPAMTQTGIPAGWADNPPTATMSVTIDDNGMGSKSIALDSPTDTSWNQATSFTSPCTGPRNARCPETLGLNFTAGNMTAEGRHTIRAVGTGIVGRQGTGTWDLKLDRTPPVLSLTGAVAAGRYVDDPGNLHVLATDGSTSSPSAERSGVKTIGLTVDGQDQGMQTQACPAGSCQMTRDYTLPAEGHHTLHVSSTDQLDHAASRDLDVIYDKTPPQITGISGTLFDHRNQASDHRNEGLYDSSYALTASAQDGGPPDNAGLKSIDIQVDGVNKLHWDAPCAGTSGCSGTTPSWTFNSDDYSDGDHTVSVIAKDAAAGQPGVNPAHHTTTQSFAVTVDRRGDIYTAKEYDNDPANGGEYLSTEWTRSSTTEARSEDGDTIGTRHAVQCPSGSSSTNCDEVAYRVLDPDTGGMTDTDEYDTTVGDRSDARLEPVSDLAQRGQAGSVVDSGPIVNAMQPWQHAPPAHGSQYRHYRDQEQTKDDDGNDVTVVTDTWVDDANLFPMKVMTSFADGTGATTIYFDYALGRLTDAEVPSDLFAVPRPANPSAENHEELDGTGSGGPATDNETSQPFTPMWLGRTAVIGTSSFCLATTGRFTSNENEPAYVPQPTDDPDVTPDPSGPITAIDADYYLTPNVTSCVPGQGPDDDPDITVSAYALASTVGRGWQTAYQQAVTEWQSHPTVDDASDAGTVPVVLGGLPAVAYVVPYAPGQLAVEVSSPTTVYTIKGRMTKGQVPAIVSAMQPIQ